MTAHDQWLERPYHEADTRLAAYERYCEANGYDFDDPAAEAAFTNHIAQIEAAAEAEIEAALAGDPHREDA
jgi:hypothetical protein